MARPRARKTNDLVIQQRRQEVARLYYSRVAQTDIASRLGVTQGTVSTDLAAIRRQWQRSAQGDFLARLAEELAKLDAIEMESWSAWRRSVAPLPKKGKPGPERPGDDRFLGRVFACVETRLKLIGALKPGQTNVNVMPGIDWSILAAQVAKADGPCPIEDLIASVGREPKMIQAVEMPSEPTEEELLRAKVQAGLAKLNGVHHE